MKLARVIGNAQRLRGLRQIGPVLQMDKSEPLTMQTAYETDCETGAQFTNDLKSKELDEKFPTICAMAELIEKERDKYKREVKRLKKLMSRIAESTRKDRSETTEEKDKDGGPSPRSVRARK